MNHGPNVRLRGIVHNAKAREGWTKCGLRFAVYALTAYQWGITFAAETTDDVNCMACIAAGQES